MNYVFDKNKPIAIGSDHAGFAYKQATINYLKEKGLEVIDFGTFDNNSVDYPDYAHPVCRSVENKESAFGILYCGTGMGMCITANKHQDIRAGLCWENDIAVLIRKHNNANVICMPARFVALELALEMLDTFITTEFEGGRHENRINKIPC